MQLLVLLISCFSSLWAFAAPQNQNNNIVFSHDPNQVELDNELRDIKGFQAIIIPDWIWWLLGFVALALIGWFLYKYITKKKEESLTLFQKTIRALDSLDLDIDSKEFYLSYSEIAKLFLENRLLVPALDKTAEEIKPLLVAEVKIQTNHAMLLSKIFYRADLAKFARMPISNEDKAKDIELTKTIFEEVEKQLILEEERKAMANIRNLDENFSEEKYQYQKTEGSKTFAKTNKKAKRQASIKSFAVEEDVE